MNDKNRLGDIEPSFNPNARETHNSTVRSKKEYIFYGVVAFLVLALAGSVYFIFNYKNELDSYEKDPTKVSDVRVEKIKNSLGKLIMLPQDIEPKVTTILDVERLREDYPEFYKNAKNGDSVVFYPDKAIIYNMDEDIIVAIAPIIREPSEEEQVEDEILSVDVRKADSEEDEFNNIKNTLDSSAAYSLLDSGKKMQNNYKGVKVVDLTGGDNKEAAEELAEDLNGEVTTISEEVDSEAVLLVIVGK